MTEIINILNSFTCVLQRKRKFKFWCLLFYMLIHALIEIMVVAVLSGYVSLVIRNKMYTEVPYLENISEFLNITSQRQFLIYASFSVLAIIVLKNVSKIVLEYSVSRYSSNISADVGKYLTAGFLSMPYEWYMKQKISDLILTIQWRSEVGLMISSLLNIIADLILTIIIFIVFVGLNTISSLFVVVLTCLLGWWMFQIVKKRLDSNVKILRDCSLAIHRSSSRSIYGYKEIKIYGMEEEAVTEYSVPAGQYAKANAMKSLYLLLPPLSVETIGITLLVSYVAAIMLIQGHSGTEVTSQLAVIVLIVWRALPAVNRLVNNFTKFRKVLPAVQTVQKFVEKIRTHTSSIHGDSMETRISLEKEMIINGLDFCYSGSAELALQDIDFSLSKGMSVGVVGLSGAGKSTLADVLVGLLRPIRGELQFHRERKSVKNSLIKLSKMSYVSQTPFFFDGSIAENIAFSIDKEKIDYDLLYECCGMAAIGELIEGLPEGYETVIGERGIRLSGGQLQRVAIARALYRKPDIILFDESTSSLDLKSEQAIQKTINQLTGDLTLIIIAHRLETVEKCDQIVWIDNGQIVASGPVTEILPRYRDALQ